jgi:uncharacterized protein YehS (DUF1456 family)
MILHEDKQRTHKYQMIRLEGLQKRYATFVGMTNNDILKKLRVALKLKNTDIIEILKLVDFRISESELGALFRKEDHPNYKECGDQILRNFLNGLVIHLRGPREDGAKEQE